MNWAQWLRSLGASEGALSADDAWRAFIPAVGALSAPADHAASRFGRLSQDRGRLRSDRAPAGEPRREHPVQLPTRAPRPIGPDARDGDGPTDARRSSPPTAWCSPCPSRCCGISGSIRRSRPRRPRSSAISATTRGPVSSCKRAPGSGRRRSSRGAREPMVPADIWDMGYGLPGTAPDFCRLRRVDRTSRPSFSALPPEDRSSLRQVVGSGRISRYSGASARKCWSPLDGRAPGTRGAFSVFYPGQMSHWTNTIVRPEGRVHFAGEHTAAHSGWIEGALWSGDHVSQEILQQ